MSGELHPHDQHGRHGTHCIVPHGAKERSQVEETLRRAKLPPLSLARDDFPSVVLSERYRDRRIKLDQDRLICEGHKGWSSVFATHACSSGCYFFEVEALSPKTDTLHFAGYPPDMQPRVHPYFRVGWACRYQRFDLPIGSNSFSYAISDFDKISVVHEARREQLLSDVNIKVGDVIGCSICIPEPAEWPPDPREDSKLYEFLLAGILCCPETPPQPRRSSAAVSWIDFFLNGKKLPRAFSGLSEGDYHPAISLYMGARLRFNPGPDFKYPPPESEGALGACYMQRPFIP